MESNSDTFRVSPPRLIGSVVAGFNAIASHVYLIILPILLDLFIWLGPHVRIKTLLEPTLNNFFIWLIEYSTADVKDMLKSFQDLFQAMLNQTNLMLGLRTWPVGVPSLFFGNSSMQTPIGDAPILEVPNMPGAILIWVLIIVVGTLGGTFFFSSISNASFGLKKPFSIRLMIWESGQCLLLATLMVILGIAILIPVSMVISVFGLFSAGLAELAMWAILFLLVWMMLPLVFSAHGIFVFKFNTIISITTSVRLVRSFLPGTGIFLVTTFLVNEGMNILWRTSPATSWMTLVGVAGHAFIVSALLAASFIYYGSGMRWMHDNLQRVSPQATHA
jgi:hypothetical protein